MRIAERDWCGQIHAVLLHSQRSILVRELHCEPEPVFSLQIFAVIPNQTKSCHACMGDFLLINFVGSLITFVKESNLTMTRF